jgi:acyl-CoA reductase-like NAD-dependent aldehyde dehydrogenase
MLALAALLEEVGVPAGVLNVIPTRTSGKVVAPLITDSRLRKLTFTGSTPVGKDLIRQSADQVLRISMELGGNAPFLVFDDADLDAAVDGAMLAKMRNMGEACTAANRFLVHHSVASEFAHLLAARMNDEKLGPGIEDGVTVGPLIDAKSRTKVTELVGDAAERGADIITGGARSMAQATSTLRPCSPMSRREAPFYVKRSSDPSLPSSPSATIVKRSNGPTTPSTGSRHTRSLRAWNAPSTSARHCILA